MYKNSKVETVPAINKSRFNIKIKYYFINSYKIKIDLLIRLKIIYYIYFYIYLQRSEVALI